MAEAKKVAAKKATKKADPMAELQKAVEAARKAGISVVGWATSLDDEKGTTNVRL